MVSSINSQALYRDAVQSFKLKGHFAATKSEAKTKEAGAANAEPASTSLESKVAEENNQAKEAFKDQNRRIVVDKADSSKMRIVDGTSEQTVQEFTADGAHTSQTPQGPKPPAVYRSAGSQSGNLLNVTV